MKQFLTVLKFELSTYFKNKSFLTVTILLMLLSIVGVGVAAVVLGKEKKPVSQEQVVQEGDEKQSLVVFVDQRKELRDLSFTEELTDICILLEKNTEKEAEEMVESGKAKMAFVLTGDTSYKYIVQNSMFWSREQEQFEELLAKHYRAKVLREKGLNPEELEALFSTPMQSEVVIKGKDSVNNYWYTYVMVMILYMMIMFYGQMIAVSVTTEKSNRAIEILVTSANSNSLIFGKILAGALAGVLQTGLFLGTAMLSYNIFKERLGGKLDFLFHIPTNVWLIFILFGVFGYLLYACMYGMLGALVSKTEDISKSSGVVTLLSVASFMIAMFGMTMSDSLLMKIASFVPFTSTNAMLVRMTMGEVATWEIAVSAVLLIVTCAGAGVLAAKIFRMGTLMYGNPIKFTVALKKIKEQ